MGRTATSCRSARPRTRRDGRRCTRLPLRLRVELPREESRRRFQNLIRPAQLAVLPLELDQTRSFARRDPVTRTAIDLTLAHPIADRFGMHTELLADLIEAAIVLLPRCTPLVHEPHSTLRTSGGYGLLPLPMTSSFPKDEASITPGAHHSPVAKPISPVLTAQSQDGRTATPPPGHA